MEQIKYKVFNVTQVRKSQGHLMAGAPEPEVWDEFLSFSLRLNSWSYVHLDPFYLSSGSELGSTGDKLRRMGTEFCLLCFKSKDYRGLLWHRIKVSFLTGMMRPDSRRHLLPGTALISTWG